MQIVFVFCSRQLMPLPSLLVNGVRPKIEERQALQGPMGKRIVLWIDKKSYFFIHSSLLCTLSLM